MAWRELLYLRFSVASGCPVELNGCVRPKNLPWTPRISCGDRHDTQMVHVPVLDRDHQRAQLLSNHKREQPCRVDARARVLATNVLLKPALLGEAAAMQSSESVKCNVPTGWGPWAHSNSP